jgi:hypothetical protein
MRVNVMSPATNVNCVECAVFDVLLKVTMFAKYATFELVRKVLKF